VREALEDQRWADANQHAKLTADALNAYSDRLDEATARAQGEVKRSAFGQPAPTGPSRLAL